MSATAPTRHSHLITDTDKLLDMITSGLAIFTIKSLKSGQRATYRVEREELEDGEVRYLVSAFTGTKNWLKSSYTFMGVMDEDGRWTARTEMDVLDETEAAIMANGPRWTQSFIKNVRRYKKNGWSLSRRMEKRLDIERRRYKVHSYISDHVKLTAFPWLWMMLTENHPLPKECEIWHEGCCMRCGKRLTVPASIELGFGPDCAADLGRYEEWKALDTLLGRDLESYAAKLKAEGRIRDAA